jgi:putative inorganic carbon (hco3(-)) transporter
MGGDSFSLVSLYQHSRGAKIIDLILIALICIIVFGAPLPFGSVEYSWLAVLQATAAFCFFLWILKLVFFADSLALKKFQNERAQHKKQYERAPFFHRHFLIAETLRLFTIDKWPRKNQTSDLIDDHSAPRRYGYFCIFGYPVKKTGVEALAVGFLFLVAVQILPLPSMLHQYVSSSQEDLYQTAAEVAGLSSATMHPFSVSPFHTLSKLLEYGAYFFLYLVTVNVVRTRTLFWALVTTICISATFQAVYGMYEYLSGHQQIFAYKKQAAYDAASGTFINRNHFAVYLAMALPLLVAIILEKLSSFHKLGQTLLTRLVRTIETQGQVLLFVAMGILICAALIFSMSRGGIVFAALSTSIFFVLYNRKKTKWTAKIAIFLFVACVIGLAALLGLAPLIERFAKISHEWTGPGSRLQLWKDTLKIFAHFPLTGSGAGTFEQIFPMYRTSVYEYHFAHAHNDYLQMLAENGFAMLLLTAMSFLLLFHRLKTVLSRAPGRLTFAQIGTFCSLLALALHSIFDFSLQIPAIGAQAAVTTALFFTSYHATE